MQGLTAMQAITAMQTVTAMQTGGLQLPAHALVAAPEVVHLPTQLAIITRTLCTQWGQ